jgi:hypothetical protein
MSRSGSGEARSGTQILRDRGSSALVTGVDGSNSVLEVRVKETL